MRLSSRVPRHVPPPEAFSLRTHRFLAAGLEQQMWFWGCDAACPDGNLLVRHGFARFRPENTAGASSRYGLDLPGGGSGRVELHGWCAGLYRAEGGFIYVRAGERVAFYDAPVPPAPGQYQENLRAPGRRPDTRYRCACSAFLTWMLFYEGWVATTFDPRYRARCRRLAPRPWLPPGEARLWLAAHLGFLQSSGVDGPDGRMG